MANDVLDTVVAAETPEGILLELRPAGLSARFYAFLLDWLIRLLVAYVALIATAFMGGFGMAFWLLFYFLLEWFYPVVFELSRSGATPGKSIVGSQSRDGRRLARHAGCIVHAQSAACRRFPAVRVRLQPSSRMLLRRDCKRLGDLAAATSSCMSRNARRKLKLDDVAPVIPVLPLAPRDQAAIVALAARAPTLTGERLDELAALAAAVSGDAGRAGPNVTRRVLGVAQWAMGKRA